MLVSTGTLVAFASTGIGDIKDSTSQASSGELVEIATDKLYSTAGSIRNALDRQMGSQYETVKTWAKDPSFCKQLRKPGTTHSKSSWIAGAIQPPVPQ